MEAPGAPPSRVVPREGIRTLPGAVVPAQSNVVVTLRPTVCPWCRERVRPAAPGGACPACGRALQQDGVALRPVDVASDGVLAEQDARVRPFLLRGTLVALAGALAMQVVHALAVLAPALAVIHLLTVRLTLIRRSYLLLGPTRRRFNRWILRLATLWVGIPGFALGATPGLGIVVPPVVFAGLTLLAHAYTRSSVEMEKGRQPLRAWEKIVLGVLTVSTVVALVLLVVLAGTAWVAIDSLRAWLAAR